MVERYEHNKLVRDNIPRLIRERGEECEVRQIEVGSRLHIKLLMDKFVEELEEVRQAVQANDKGQLGSELSDFMQVVIDLAWIYGINVAELWVERKEKEDRLGGFRTGQFLLWSSRPKGAGMK